MKFTLISSCVALAFVALAVEAAPGGKKISIPLAKNNDYKPNAKRAIQKANAKYSRFSGNSTGHASPDGTGSVPVTDYHGDVEYYGEVTVGTPGVTLKLDFDTGSSDLWFASTLCSNCGGSQTKYDPSKSKTYVKDGRSWSISYGDGSSAGGILGKDTVNLGGLSIKGQTIELAKTEASSFQSGPSDGLLGLGFDSITTVRGVKTPVDNLISQGLISNPVFGVYLGKASNGGGGEYIFGGYDSSKFSGELTTVSVDSSNGWYSVTVDGTSIGGSSVTDSFSAILDTGTTLLILPQNIASSIASAYNANDNGDGTYTIGCDTSSLSPLEFSIGSATFNVPTDSLIFEQDGSTCIAGFGYGQEDFAIFGDVFLKNNYVVFNPQVPQVQIAPISGN
ncbi:rhizopuspepsin precursor-like protein [Sporodiniella umbellata]|nr:rhizopuspepsin precursor-like protein [Sporodiniella umbellata]